MTSTPLILTLTVLTATILAFLILWVFFRYAKDRRARHTQRRAQLNQDAAYAADHGENAESRIHLHCTTQPAGAPHGASHDGGVELRIMKERDREEDSTDDKAEVWLKRGASADNLRAVREEDGKK